MNKFRVTLTRAYFVTIEAEDEDQARSYAEFYINDVKAVSAKQAAAEHQFLIQDIEPLMNEATEVIKVTGDSD